VPSYCLISEILNALNNKNIIGGIFCDLTKAFVYINQGILLSKLRYCGITDTFYSLIKPYLETRHQRAKLVNNDYKPCSSLGIVKHGVLQGSVIGLLLFLFCVNGVMKITSTADNSNTCKLFLFADGTSLIITSLNTTNFVE